MQKIYYKVVKALRLYGPSGEIHFDYRSWSPPHSTLALYYVLNQVTEPYIGYLFAFDNQRDTYKMIRHYGIEDSVVILAGEGQVAGKSPPNWVLESCSVDTIKTWWEDPRLQEEHIRAGIPTPQGTVFLKWFKPLEIFDTLQGHI